ncbi:MAG: ABC transporter permease [Actinomycetota bacterium]|nr:ABC transporter permease [Actinomycetota bacterium]
MSQVASETGVVGGAAYEDVTVEGRTPWQLFWLRFREDKVAFIGLAFLVLLAASAIGAPLFAKLTGHGPNDLFQTTMMDSFGIPKGPNAHFWFGADVSGRDLFVRVLYGARTSLLVGVVATSFSTVVGVILGMSAGYFGGKVDTIISRTIDIVLSMPLLLFALGIVAACSTSKEGCFGGLIQPGLPLVIFVIALFSWPYIGRIVRGNTLSIKQKEFIEASRSLGAGNIAIMFREVLPNLVAPIIVYATLIIPNNIVFEASLSFLGLGVPQTIPSWGRMLSDASETGLFQIAWWLMFFPGLFLFMTTLAFNLFGDGLRDALDPRTGRN